MASKNWELPPYLDIEQNQNINYFLWYDNHTISGIHLNLSNTSDVCESIRFASEEEIDELITRLTLAKQIFKHGD